MEAAIPPHLVPSQPDEATDTIYSKDRKRMNRVPKVTREMDLLENQANSTTRQYSVSGLNSIQAKSRKQITTSAGTVWATGGDTVWRHHEATNRG